MKTNELNNFIENIIKEEIKGKILNEMEEGKKEVYHIKCNGEPIDTFSTKEEAESHLDIYKKEHPGKQFIIEKGMYGSDSDMIDKLDEMGEELEEKENIDMKKTPVKVKSFAEAILHAKNNGVKKLRINDELHDVDESWKSLEEEEGMYDEMDEELKGNQDKIDADKDGKITSKDFKMLRGEKNTETKEEEECYECGDMKEEETCPKCGETVCECGYMMNESKGKKLRLTEAQLVDLIGKMVVEATSGIPLQTKKAQEGSKRENTQHLKDVEKKMKDYLSFDGNDNPEFPHQVGGKKIAYKNTSKEEDFIANNRGGGLQNLDYDVEPSERFKERLKMAIEGSPLMGNAPTTEKSKLKPSNDADKGKDSEHESGNTIKTDTDKKIEKQIKGRSIDKKKRTLYPKEKVPVQTVKENKLNFSDVLKDEFEKMNKISNYNKKTQ